MQSTGQTSTQAVSFVPMHGSVMMYATLMSSKPTKGPALDTLAAPGSQPRSITRAFGAESRSAKAATAGIVAAVAVLACTVFRSAPSTPLRASAQLPDGPSTTLRAGPSTALRAGWRDAPQYVRLFAPEAKRAAYRAYVSPLGLEATLEQITADPAILHPPGAWTPQAMIPYDAFGLSGSYNRWKVAGLYRSRRAQVARGPRVDQGGTESWTLIAPYPDEALQRLEPGTLIIVLRIPSD